MRGRRDCEVGGTGRGRKDGQTCVVPFNILYQVFCNVLFVCVCVCVVSF